MAPVITDELIHSFYGVTGEPFPEYDSYLAKKRQKEQKDSYSEEAFTADRNNEMQMGMTAFDVQGEDVLSSSTEVGYASNAPTRPPSPNNTIYGQETGITGTKGHSFIGPLPQNNYHYDPSNWALVPVTSAAEIFLDPAADMRKRDIDLGEPVVMRPTREEPLANVVTILGHIPLARAILGGGSTTAIYGSDPEWWKGTKIELASVSHSEEPHNQSAYDLKEETERLMAFMSCSTRSYGSVVPLSQLGALKNAKASDGVNISTNAERFLTAWSEMAMQLNLHNTIHSANLFQTVALHIREGEEEDETPSFYIIDLKLERNIDSEPRTLYDGVDETLWGGDVDGTTKENYCLHKFPPVLFIRVRNLDASRPGLDMDVPRTWYVDRYLEKNMDAAKAMRRKRSEYRQAIKSLQEREDKLDRIVYPIKEKGKECDKANEQKVNNHTFMTNNLLQSTINYLDPSRAMERAAKQDGENEEDKKIEMSGASVQLGKGNGKDPNGVATPGVKQATIPKPPDPTEKRNKQLAEQLAKISAKVVDKISELQKQREQVQSEMMKLSKDFTGDGSPTHRYSLRGVSMGPAHTEQYILVDPSAELVAQQDEDEAIDIEVPSQWWHIQFSHEQPAKEKVDIESVVKAASESSGDVLLVYATDIACERQELNLSGGLKTFIEKDNEYFAQEIAVQSAAQNDPMDTDQTQKSLPSDPPPYDQLDWTENDGRWVVPPSAGQGFTPDPGPSVISDAEYQMNTDPYFYQNSYSNAYASNRDGFRDGEDVRMGGTSSERIEDVTDIENIEIRKGG
ncbi:hypothetical protein FKW77_010167 [Venturia effusa]|uniref:Uncharacterized protein n=1 Tax=Venturia effusa TaxID=50376 RepID=A0A517L4C8_9PEZI|nr:hypothetical protein FKW77_010167 [Venturia effusa]